MFSQTINNSFIFLSLFPSWIPYSNARRIRCCSYSEAHTSYALRVCFQSVFSLSSILSIIKQVFFNKYSSFLPISAVSLPIDLFLDLFILFPIVLFLTAYLFVSRSFVACSIARARV